jgi:hypothetical protein
MAAPDNTALSTVAVGNREQLSNIVSRITPEDTPIYTMAGKEKVKGTHPEWEIDELRAPAENIQTEGDDYSFSAITQPVRVGNYTQIFREGWIFSGTQEAVENAGNVVKSAEKKIKAGIEVRKDCELAIVTNNASVAGATREFGSLPTWLTTNVSRGAGGSNGGFNSGTGLTVAETTGTQRAWTKALTDSLLQSGYEEGANLKRVVCSPYNKGEFVKFMSDANVAEFRYAVDGKGKNTIVGTADIYESPHGKVMVEPNRVMGLNAAVARRVFFLDPEMIDILSLRPIQEDPDLAKTGDNKKGIILGELSLKVKNEAGLGMISDVFGMSATS